MVGRRCLSTFAIGSRIRVVPLHLLASELFNKNGEDIIYRTDRDYEIQNLQEQAFQPVRFAIPYQVIDQKD